MPIEAPSEQRFGARHGHDDHGGNEQLAQARVPRNSAGLEVLGG